MDAGEDSPDDPADGFLRRCNVNRTAKVRCNPFGVARPQATSDSSLGYGPSGGGFDAPEAGGGVHPSRYRSQSLFSRVLVIGRRRLRIESDGCDLRRQLNLHVRERHLG